MFACIAVRLYDKKEMSTTDGNVASSSQPLQDAGKLEWGQPLHNGSFPSRRSGHSFTIIGSNGYLFGGIDHKSPPGPTNEMYILELKNDAFRWKKINAEGDAPLPRWRHTANVAEETSILVFGGIERR